MAQKIFLARDKIDLAKHSKSWSLRHRFVKIQLVDYDYDHDCDYYFKRGMRTISQSPKKEKKIATSGYALLELQNKYLFSKKILDNSLNEDILTLLVNMNFIFSLRSKILCDVLCYMVPLVATTLHMFTEEMRAVSDALFSVLLRCFSVHDNKLLNIHGICNWIIAHFPHLNHEVAIKCNFYSFLYEK